MNRITKKPQYPRIRAEGLKVVEKEHEAYMPRAAMTKWFKSKSKGFQKLYCEYYGVQTASIHGPYPWDVEAVLERMYSGRLSGSQANWD